MIRPPFCSPSFSLPLFFFLLETILSFECALVHWIRESPLFLPQTNSLSLSLLNFQGGEWKKKKEKKKAAMFWQAENKGLRFPESV